MVDGAGGLGREQPTLRASIVWGALMLAELNERWATYVLECWANGRSSLLAQLAFASPPAASTDEP